MARPCKIRAYCLAPGHPVRKIYSGCSRKVAHSRNSQHFAEGERRRFPESAYKGLLEAIFGPISYGGKKLAIWLPVKVLWGLVGLDEAQWRINRVYIWARGGFMGASSSYVGLM